MKLAGPGVFFFRGNKNAAVFKRKKSTKQQFAAKSEYRVGNSVGKKSCYMVGRIVVGVPSTRGHSCDYACVDWRVMTCDGLNSLVTVDVDVGCGR